MGIHLAYLTYHLAQHPSIQKRLRVELHNSNATANSLRSLDNLPLLEAVVLETHRLTPSISGPLPRVTPPQGCELAGFFIPGGVRVSGQAYSLHKEERIFGPDAGKWRPDRWLEAGEGKGKEMKRWMWHFGGGGRGCLGQHFATLRQYHPISCWLFDSILGNIIYSGTALLTGNSTRGQRSKPSSPLLIRPLGPSWSMVMMERWSSKTAS